MNRRIDCIVHPIKPEYDSYNENGAVHYIPRRFPNQTAGEHILEDICACGPKMIVGSPFDYLDQTIRFFHHKF